MWRRYQERQYVKLSIYALWHEVVELLGYRPFKAAAAQDILSHLRLALTNSDAAEKWLGKDFPPQTIAVAMHWLLQQHSFKPHEFGRKAIKLAEILKDLNTSTNERVGAAVIILLLCGCYWQRNGNTLAENQIHKQGGIERISLEAIYKDLGQQSDTPVAEYLQWIVENYVLKQSTRVAIQKLPDYRFFIVRDEEGYRLVKRQNPQSYLSYDSSRIGSAFELMADLKLIDMNGAITLTATGRKILQKLRVFHQTAGGIVATAARA